MADTPTHTLPRLMVRLMCDGGAVEIVCPVTSVTISAPLPPIGAARSPDVDPSSLDYRGGVRVAWRPLAPGEESTVRVYRDARQLADAICDRGRPIRPLP